MTNLFVIKRLYGKRFYHCVDMGIYIYRASIGDGTSIFEKEKGILDPISTMKNDGTVIYSNREMTLA